MKFRKILFVAIAAWVMSVAGAGHVGNSLWADFVNPPDAAKPWCYYLWQNGLADRETIAADLEAMKRLGFGDCFLMPGERVTRSTLRYCKKPRGKTDPKRPWLELPTVNSGPAVSDSLQPSGLLGPVYMRVSVDRMRFE